MDASWDVVEFQDDAATAHQRPLPHPLRPTVWVEHPPRPALVLGSTQRREVVRSKLPDGWDLTTRRSGGGLVLIEPATTVWVDVIVPRGHDRWDDDIGRAFHWVGEAWQAALAETVGVTGLLHRGAAVDAEAGRVLCFAGLGHGELTVSGSKVVGLSQRRTRDAARIQGLAVLHSDPDTIARVLEPATFPEGVDPRRAPIGLPGHSFDEAAELRAALELAVVDRLVAAGQQG